MIEPGLEQTLFPTARCEGCDRIVLTYVTLDESNNEVRNCVHCDHQVVPALSWVVARELEDQGYYFGAAPERKSGGGCGSGCKSCQVKGA